METIKKWLKQTMNLELPKDETNTEWYKTNYLPNMVYCVCCEHKLKLNNALIDVNGDIYCSKCGK